jgi:hypothetical protein
VRVSPLFERTPFVVRTGESTWAEDPYHGWFVAPALVLRELTAAWLAGAGLYARVVGDEHRGSADAVLDGRVDALHFDLRDPLSPAAVLEVEFVLRELAGVERVERFRRRYAVRVPAAGSTAEAAGPRGAGALVSALGEALSQVLQRLEDDLRALAASAAGT